MDSLQIIRAVSLGISLYAGLYHLLVSVRRRPTDQMHLFFALTALMVSLQSIGDLILFPAARNGQLETYLLGGRISLSGWLLSQFFIIWFVTFYTQARPILIPAVLSLAYMVFLWVHLTSSYFYLFSEEPVFNEYVLPWGESFWDGDAKLTVWASLEFPLTLALSAYFIYCVALQFCRGEHRKATFIGIAIAIYLVLTLNDILLDFNLINSVYATALGFPVVILVMSLTLSDETIRTEKALETLNIELEKRIEARTAELSIANQNLMKAKDQAQAANRAKSEFLANMSHELRTPLNTILGYAQILSRDDSLKPEQNKGIGAINRSGDHLLTLINNVLEMSKIEVGQTVLNPSPLGIDSLLNDMMMMFGDRAKGKHLQFIIEKDPHPITSIKADRGKVSQILINLLSNAFRYTQNGRITLRVKIEETPGDTPDLVFEVEDTGEGIFADDLEHIFDPFFQGGTGKRSRAGTGLGLTISRQYARMMHGDVVVESRVGRGSVFRFRMPTIESESAPHKIGLVPSRRIVGIADEKRKLRVLVVDDEPSNRDVIVRMLSPAGFDIREATGGQEAIDLFESWCPHLILMDIRMPGIDGLQAIKTIKAEAPGHATTIIGISASVFEEERKMVLESGADEFIAKPIQEIELWEKIAHRMKIDFLYSDRESTTAELPDPIPLTREHVTELPANLVEEMGAAIRGGYKERLAELVKGAAEGHPELSQQLMQLVNQYDYEALSRLFLKDTIDAGKTDG